MSRIDGYTEGFDACKKAVIEVLKGQMGDRSCGEDMRAHYDAALSSALQKIEELYAGNTRIVGLR